MDREQTPDTATADALNGAIEKLMAHPELITMVASALGKSNDAATASAEAPKPLPPSETASAPTESAQAPVAPELSKVISTLSPLLSGSERRDDPRASLLRALKPYVKPARRDAIDTMIRLSQVSDVLRHLNSQ